MGDETAQVQAPIPVLDSFESLVDNLIFDKLALLDRLVDADHVLPHDPPRTNVEMADFRVAHEAFRETDGERRGLELCETSLALGELIHHRGVGSSNGVAILGRILRWDTPAVNHDYKSERAS